MSPVNQVALTGVHGIDKSRPGDRPAGSLQDKRYGSDPAARVAVVLILVFLALPGISRHKPGTSLDVAPR